ncbi:MAG: ArsR/SmtB family transcription factor [Phycisphaerales bacterium]
MSIRPAKSPGMQRVTWLTELLRAPIRLELLGALAGEPGGVEADVGALAVATGRELSHVSQHLVQLLAAGLVERRIVWKRHHYRLAEGVRVESRNGLFTIAVRHADGGATSVSDVAPVRVTKETDPRGADRDRAGRAG